MPKAASGAQSSNAGPLVAHAVEGPLPAGWEAAMGVDADESCRLVALLAARALSRGDLAADLLTVPAAGVSALLTEALLPVEDAALLAAAPQPSAEQAGWGRAEAAVAVGDLVKFWFDVVWPKHGPSLRVAALRLQEEQGFRGALTASVEFDASNVSE